MPMYARCVRSESVLAGPEVILPELLCVVVQQAAHLHHRGAGAMEPNYAMSEPVMKLISSQNFQYADVVDALPGYLPCEIGTYCGLFLSKPGMQMQTM